MLKECSWCGNRTDCILIRMLSWLCPKCFIKFYDYWIQNSIDFLGLYVQFKLHETYNTSVDLFKQAEEQVRILKTRAIIEGKPILFEVQKIKSKLKEEDL